MSERKPSDEVWVAPWEIRAAEESAERRAKVLRDEAAVEVAIRVLRSLGVEMRVDWGRSGGSYAEFSFKYRGLDLASDVMIFDNFDTRSPLPDTEPLPPA